MIRFLFLLCCGAAPALWGQAEGRYHWALLSVKTGVAFEAQVKTGVVSVVKQTTARFPLENPAAMVAASPSGSVLAGAPASGQPGLFVAVRAAGPEQPPRLAAGEWSAVMISFDGGKARGLKTGFLDFTVGPDGAIANASMVAHESAVDDVNRAGAIELKSPGPGMVEVAGVKHALAVGVDGAMFLATSAAPKSPSLVIAARRDRDATTMAMRGTYALAEIGARNSFVFAPDQARFFATQGTLDANAGQGRLSQRVILADSTMQFGGSAAYMVTAAGAGTLSPRLEQRRRNMALGADGGVFITAQVGEAGQLSLVHGIGIGVRVGERNAPSLAATATAEGNVVSLYGQNLEGVHPIIAGAPADIVQAWPNQINVKLASPPAKTLSVALEGQGGRTTPAPVTITAAPPALLAEPGGWVAPVKPGAPGEMVEIGVTGGTPPPGFTLLFDGAPGQVVSSSVSGGVTRVKVTLPKSLVPSQQVNVAIATPTQYVDLGDIAVARPRPDKP